MEQCLRLHGLTTDSDQWMINSLRVCVCVRVEKKKLQVISVS